MQPPITPEDARILGALIEKELTTPEYYPLSLNYLVNACNQKSNRDPVTAYEEMQVNLRCKELALRNFVRTTRPSDSRVFKYAQTLSDALALTGAQTAILCELLLRGSQTLGELRGRASRLHPFEDLGSVEAVLDQLQHSDPWPLVIKLPRRTGQKEMRYAHLLCGPPNDEVEEPAPLPHGHTPSSLIADTEAAMETQRELEARVAALEQAVASLRMKIERLSTTLATLSGE
ncbi:MAG: hypothetical protein A2284_17445 [Deltaproteobacteria bacterium RIFOXYA12_FULL_61_11]|nr:MAG: hypothetical protein A2284_17445 [Deltaproteobacteria bacterium RIFOXYA12_FULL_61_11]